MIAYYLFLYILLIARVVPLQNYNVVLHFLHFTLKNIVLISEELLGNAILLSFVMPLYIYYAMLFNIYGVYFVITTFVLHCIYLNQFKIGGIIGYVLAQHINVQYWHLIIFWLLLSLYLVYIYYKNAIQELAKQLFQKVYTYQNEYMKKELTKNVESENVASENIINENFTSENIANENIVTENKSEEAVKTFIKTSESKIISQNQNNRWKLPSTNLLSHVIKKSRNMNSEKMRNKLSRVLKEFKIDGELVSYSEGPVVTLHKFCPAPGIQASRIVSLSQDIARTAETRSVRIAQIPGRNLLGIEVANTERETIALRETIESKEFSNSQAILPLAIGCDISGVFVCVDLAQMPHLLVAGTTGSGKSVSIHSMLLSILYRYTPDECKLILVDPKMLELSVYHDIPHLMSPVVTDSKHASVVLKWAVKEMERRYQLLSDMQVRNISGYNAKSDEKLPYLVVVVDEMADLMLVAGREVEMSIQRLAQMARASGIHIIMATQRPSVDVITGTIKANFPTRITFQLASKIDSRTITGDQSGAEYLLGKGDMLYISPGHGQMRLHGPFVSDDEVNDVANFWRSQGEPDYVDLVVDDEINQDTEIDLDELYTQAKEIVLQDRRTSTGNIQAKLGIGYPRANRLVIQLEKTGVISSPDERGRRKIIE
mgnify:CR=1 FL=1